MNCVLVPKKGAFSSAWFRASVLQAEGRGFKSTKAHKIKKYVSGAFHKAAKTDQQWPCRSTDRIFSYELKDDGFDSLRGLKKASVAQLDRAADF